MFAVIQEIVFWTTVGFVIYSYAGYPLLLWAVAQGKARPQPRGAVTPPVSLIIAAHNEGRRLRGKLENTLALDYPADRLEIIVASDCSTDETDRIALSFSERGVRLVRSPERKGKEYAQRLAVEASSGEAIVFSDAATILQPDGVRCIVQGFADPTVGCVSSVDRFIGADGSISGEGAYVRYEMLLRKLETRANTLVGLSGSFFAARREVCTRWAVDLPSDFNTLLNSVRQGLRGISDAGSIGFYRTITDEKREYDRKVRTVLRGIATLSASLPMLNPFKYGMFAWQLFSHKLCRWLVPFALIAAFASSALLAGSSPVYLVLFLVQSVFYAIGCLGMRTRLIPDGSLLKIAGFFLVVNLAILSAWYRFARGERRTLWNPSVR